MEEYILITYLNDFVFCPLSIYYHRLYGKTSNITYYNQAQLMGRNKHEAIDEKRYSSRKNILQGSEVYSSQYRLCGKIDTFDIEAGLLTERKKKIKQIYDGYIFQMYAQYFCLEEMGYKVKKMPFYSSDDNKIFPLQLPNQNQEMFQKFLTTISAINNFNIYNYQQNNEAKCLNCIYEPICDRSLLC